MALLSLGKLGINAGHLLRHNALIKDNDHNRYTYRLAGPSD